MELRTFDGSPCGNGIEFPPLSVGMHEDDVPFIVDRAEKMFKRMHIRMRYDTKGML